MSKKIGIILSYFERKLVTEHGYPFEEIASQLLKGRENPCPLFIEADELWMEQLLGYLAWSINHQRIPDEQARKAVNEIANRIELALESQ